jgi:hypothetical protein
MVKAALLVALVAVAPACGKQDNPYDKSDPGPAGPAKMTGQDPDHFDCTKVLTDADVSQAAGEPVKMHDTTMPPEPGEAKPCAFRSTLPPAGDAGTVHEWQVSFDCRTNKGVVDADRYMNQYLKDPDAQAKEVPGVGKRAVDEQNIRLIAIDDDTPCSLMVIGPDITSRTNLAKLAAMKLNEDNMPRRVRAVKTK